MKPIYYVSAPCAAGKTFEACRYIRDNILEQNFILVGLTISVLAEYHTTFDSLGVAAQTITSQDSENVCQAILDAMQSGEPYGQVLLVTHEAYFRMPWYPGGLCWQPIIDEIPTVDTYYPIHVGRHHEWAKQDLTIKAALNDRLGYLGLKDKGRLLENMAQKNDSVVELNRDLYRALGNPNYEAFVNPDKFDELVVNQGASDVKGEAVVPIISMLTPRPFEGAIVMGANIEDSLWFDWMKRYHKRRLIPFDGIKPSRGPSKGGVKAYYFVDKPASKSRLYKKEADGRMKIEHMDKKALELLGPDASYVCNNDRNLEKSGFKKKNHIPVICHGQNKYSYVENLYVSAILNRRPDHMKLLFDLGFRKKQIQIATGQETIYQITYRTSIRKVDFDGTINVVVLDKGSAERLQKLIPGTTIEKIPDFDDKLSPLSPTDKSRRKVAKESLAGAMTSRFIPSPIDSIGNSMKPETFGSLGSQAGRDTNVWVTLFPHKLATKQEGTLVQTTIEAFVELLKKQSKHPTSKKEEQMLVCPAVFGDGNQRNRGNMLFAFILVLDFDNGDLSIEKFIDLFDGKHAAYGKKRSFVICNSFTRSESEPNRFRVFMFFNRPATSAEAYKAVVQEVEERIKAAGITKSGLDTNSKSPVHLFYLPCTNRKHPDYAYFKAFGVTKRDLKRRTIDPNKLVDLTPKQESKPNLDYRSRKTAEEILAPYLGLREGRNGPIFSCTRDLKNLGLSDAEVRFLIHQTFGTDKSAKKKVTDALRSVTKGRASP